MHRSEVEGSSIFASLQHAFAAAAPHLPPSATTCAVSSGDPYTLAPAAPALAAAAPHQSYNTCHGLQHGCGECNVVLKQPEELQKRSSEGPLQRQGHAEGEGESSGGPQQQGHTDVGMSSLAPEQQHTDAGMSSLAPEQQHTHVGMSSLASQQQHTDVGMSSLAPQQQHTHAGMSSLASQQLHTDARMSSQAPQQQQQQQLGEQREGGSVRALLQQKGPPLCDTGGGHWRCIKELVVYGLGSMQTSITSRYQVRVWVVEGGWRGGAVVFVRLCLCGGGGGGGLGGGWKGGGGGIGLGGGGVRLCGGGDGGGGGVGWRLEGGCGCVCVGVGWVYGCMNKYEV